MTGSSLRYSLLFLFCPSNVAHNVKKKPSKGFIFGNNHSHNTTFSYKTSNHLPLFSIISRIYEVLKGKSN